MLTTLAQNLVDTTVAVVITDAEKPTVARVDQVLEMMRMAIKVTDEEYDAARRAVLNRLILSMERGVAVAQPFESWLRHRKAEIDKYYWQRFRSHLLHDLGWGLNVVRTLDETGDELLDYAGDPLSPGSWKRRGLVVGNVQSGKTSTYTALCNKAADAGYRLIILLAGTLNSLRYQTQERLDEGFVGFDQAAVNAASGVGVIGVGRHDNSRAPNAYTTKASDFDANLLNIRTRLDSLSQPALMVVKKNKHILENLHNWLQKQNPTATGKIDVPLLLIDDEADAASVNTGTDSNPNAINAAIRRLLTLFSRSSYVGFTATPFANVFISPDSQTEMLEDDLFPKDYIYSLEPPSNYVGPVKTFITSPQDFLRHLDDAELIFPRRHKKELVVEYLPESLIDSVYCFLLANAIRDLRGHVNTHRSMLINVSYANNVQQQVAALVKDEVEAIISDAKAHGALEPERALRHSQHLSRLHELWAKEYCKSGFDWEDVQYALFDAIKAIDVRAVNMLSKKSRLDYDANKTLGLRVIAVGGNALSRGLTLEGLCTSYIFRNSQAYDTLLQMGRWFGYRDGYEDLCRIWLTAEAESWYRHITEATEELRLECKRMHDLHQTPKQFGLKVRAHPAGLIVTARAKMKTAVAVTTGVSLSAKRLDSLKMPADSLLLKENADAVHELLQSLSNGPFAVEEPTAVAGLLWRGVGKTTISQFLMRFNSDPMWLEFQPQAIAQFLNDNDVPILKLWDVGIAKGQGYSGTFGGVGYRAVQRGLVKNGPAIDIYGLRLGTGTDEQLGLNRDEKARADQQIQDAKRENSANYFYRLNRPRPLLLIYFVEPSLNVKDKNALDEAPVQPFVAVSLSVPAFDDEDLNNLVTYQTNQVWQQMRLEFESETDEDERPEEARFA